MTTPELQRLAEAESRIRKYRGALRAELADAEWRAAQARERAQFLEASIQEQRATRLRLVLSRRILSEKEPTR